MRTLRKKLIAGAAVLTMANTSAVMSQQATNTAGEPLHAFIAGPNGVLSRVLFSAPGPAHTLVTVRDFIIGTQTTQTLAGPALLERLQGLGTISVSGGRPRDLGDEVEVIPGRQPFVIETSTAPPVGIRLYIFSGE